MSRAISLTKIVLWMTIVCTLTSVLLAYLWVQLVEASSPVPHPPRYRADFLQEEITSGALTGALIGLAMALYARVDRWTYHRLAYFRFALLIVAALASLVYLGGIFHIAHVGIYKVSLIDLIKSAAEYPETRTEPSMALLILGVIARYVTIGFMSLYLAGKYWREASEQKTKPAEQTHT